MYIKRIAAALTDEEKEGFIFGDEKVQGAKIGKKGSSIYAISPKRFKLYTEGIDKIFIIKLSGEGHFKWSRGETEFKEGDAFEVSSVGEYEVNANAEFIVIRG